jgi:hypothetical protein
MGNIFGSSYAELLGGLPAAKLPRIRSTCFQAGCGGIIAVGVPSLNRAFPLLFALALRKSPRVYTACG